MKIILSIIFSFNLLTAAAQKDSIAAPFLQFPFIPQFTIAKAPDSTAFTREDLSKKKEVIIMIFSPDCDHCQHQVKDITSNISRFKDVEILMTSYAPFAQILKFYIDNKIANYSNIVMGRDPRYFFNVHYKLKLYPGLYTYDKKHRLKNHFESNVSIDKLLGK